MTETIKYIQFACQENIVQTDYNYVIIKEKTDGRPFNQTGGNVQISMQTAKDLLTPEIIATPCLPGLRIGLTYDAKCPQMILRFSDVKFQCNKELQKEKSERDTNMTAFEKMCYCADQMRLGKCKHQIGRILFPDAYKTKVYFVVHTNGDEKPEKVKLGTLTEEQKADFLDTVRKYTQTNGLVLDKCCFNVHYDSSVINVSSSANAREYSTKQQKNRGPKEIIVEIYPDRENPLCGVSTTHGCTDCLKTKHCPSPLVSDVIKDLLQPRVQK
jgi:hypothetical protein